MQLEPTNNKAQRVSNDDLPPLGSWHWCKFNTESDDDSSKKIEVEELCCVAHIASNHVRVSYYKGDERSRSSIRYKFDEWLTHTRPAPEWRDVIQKRLVEKQNELQAAVKALADICTQAHLVRDIAESPVETLALTTRRESPHELKQKLIALKETQFPAAQQNVERITQQLVCLQKSLFLTEKANFERLGKSMTSLDERLFALELYAGLVESVTQIRKGKPADAETPITIRQMLRYMDEETLIDYDKGGMDFGNIKDFDRWVSRDENLHRVAPETRCVVAFRIRRNYKDYGECSSIGHALAHMRWNEANMSTYLLMRNGDQVWRLTSEQDFSPRLLPLRDELHKPFTEQSYNWKKSDYDENEIKPDDFEYDEHVEARRKVMMKYNRIVFLVQGILDRSQVFKPHPVITLTDEAHLERYVRLVYDEQDGLPQANPPEWEQYRDEKNKAVRPDSLVYCAVGEEKSGRYCRDEHRPKYGYDAKSRPLICKVSRVSKDRKSVWLRWSLGNRITEEWVIDYTRPVTNKPHYYYRKCLKTDHGERFGVQRVEMRQVFAVEAYRPGDYKQFLCDAHQKGRYLKWSPPLLAAEKWHMDRIKAQNKKDT
jgi:hypothetical protein